MAVAVFGIAPLPPGSTILRDVQAPGGDRYRPQSRPEAHPVRMPRNYRETLYGLLKALKAKDGESKRSCFSS